MDGLIKSETEAGRGVGGSRLLVSGGVFSRLNEASPDISGSLRKTLFGCWMSLMET